MIRFYALPATALLLSATVTADDSPLTFPSLVPFDCAATPYEQGAACDVGGAFCEWYKDDGSGNECFCSDNSTATDPNKLEWDCYSWEGWTEVDFDCPAEPIQNGASCSVEGAYCFWDLSNEEVTDWAHCDCYEDRWDCYDATSSNDDYTSVPQIACPAVPFENGTSCTDLAHAVCYWDDPDDSNKYTDCWCTPDTLQWDCYDGMYHFPDASCPEEPVLNGTACDTDGALCFWEAGDNSFTDCFCFESEWECYTGNLFVDVLEADGSCPSTVAETGDACDLMVGKFCSWEGEDGTVDECVCGGGTFDCVKGVAADVAPQVV